VALQCVSGLSVCAHVLSISGVFNYVLALLCDSAVSVRIIRVRSSTVSARIIHVCSFPVHF